jgi:hypothetical protein
MRWVARSKRGPTTNFVSAGRRKRMPAVIFNVQKDVGLQEKSVPNVNDRSNKLGSVFWEIYLGLVMGRGD